MNTYYHTIPFLFDNTSATIQDTLSMPFIPDVFYFQQVSINNTNLTTDPLVAYTIVCEELKPMYSNTANLLSVNPTGLNVNQEEYAQYTDGRPIEYNIRHHNITGPYPINIQFHIAWSGLLAENASFNGSMMLVFKKL